MTFSMGVSLQCRFPSLLVQGRRGPGGSPDPDLRGGMREPKEGVTMSHAFQAPFHGVGGYIHIIYIYIYILKGFAPSAGPITCENYSNL